MNANHDPFLLKVEKGAIMTSLRNLLMSKAEHAGLLIQFLRVQGESNGSSLNDSCAF